MEYADFDMLGDPVPPNFGGRGAPPHVPTPEKRRLVMGLWAMGKSNAYCASALGISEPTFNKHYFKNKRQKTVRDEARARIDALMLNSTIKAVEEGNMAAVKALRELMHRADFERLSKDIAKGRDEDEAPKALGKKEQQREAAGLISGIFAPPPPPTTTLN